MRLDIFLVIHHHYTRNKAQQLIDMGLISVNGVKRLKASYTVEMEDSIIVGEDKRIHWVSRSATKLDGFLEDNPDIPLLGKKCLDVGSSTGGFTQVLLERGVRNVDAVDVGTDQLHPSLRGDPRIHSIEQTDIRDFSRTKVLISQDGDSRDPHHHIYYDIIVCDASFISLSDIIDSILMLAYQDTIIILLYKPQFEVGKMNLRKTGIPKNENVVTQKMLAFEVMLGEKNCMILRKEKSILLGESGNQEWIYHICKSGNYK